MGPVEDSQPLERGVPMGALLALETSWDVGSVAVALEGRVVSRRFLTERSAHGAHLVGAVGEALDEAGIGPPEVTALAVGSGPGSFTGVRIAGATGKGLAGALGIPLFAGSSLMAAAVATDVLPVVDGGLPLALLGRGPGGAPRRLDPGEREIRYVLLDARGGRVYGGCYEVTRSPAATDSADGPLLGDLAVRTLVEAHGGTIVEVLNRRSPLGTAFTGPGAAAHGDLIRAAGYGVLPAPAGIPTADGVLATCSWTPVDRGAWEPDYVRGWSPGG
ncbi:MAG: tRNA (adenosine(37)-N6)-threonylcarbamoyltransferase complex dimerization subunit type 1 TsaB [Longimicrobiales bacterium]